VQRYRQVANYLCDLTFCVTADNPEHPEIGWLHAESGLLVSFKFFE
jgi:hypothetical protein